MKLSRKVVTLLVVLSLILTMQMIIYPLQTFAVNSTAIKLLPRRYDLRDQELYPVSHDNDDVSRCTAISTINALESYLMCNSVKLNLSEAQLAAPYEKVLRSGIRVGSKVTGDAQAMVGSLTSWHAPVYETLTPYKEVSIVDKHVQGALFIPKRKDALDNRLIKEYILNYGSVVATMLNFEDSVLDKSLHTTNLSWYLDQADDLAKSTLTISILGWDDGYSRENFKTMPPGDGAFIAKVPNLSAFFNGMPIDSKTIDNGYLYISYYDTGIFKGIRNIPSGFVFNSVESNDNYDNIYQYDCGFNSYIESNEEEGWIANTYNTLNKKESLAAVGFYTLNRNLEYEVWFTNSNKDISNTDDFKIVAWGKIEDMGYHTIKLDKNIICNGQFSIALCLKSSDASIYLPIESPDEYAFSNAMANKGQGFFIVSGDTFIDITDSYKNTSVCLKAYTRDIQE